MKLEFDNRFQQTAYEDVFATATKNYMLYWNALHLLHTINVYTICI